MSISSRLRPTLVLSAIAVLGAVALTGCVDGPKSVSAAPSTPSPSVSARPPQSASPQNPGTPTAAPPAVVDQTAEPAPPTEAPAAAPTAEAPPEDYDGAALYDKCFELLPDENYGGVPSPAPYDPSSVTPARNADQKVSVSVQLIFADPAVPTLYELCHVTGSTANPDVEFITVSD